MAKDKITYRCSECGWSSPKWVGQCRECTAWGTVDQAGEASGVLRASATPPRRPARPIGEVDGERAASRSTGVGELDRVLGGGIVPGAVILLAGEPGVGKSTLLLDVAAKAARTASDSGRGPVLYVTGEESAAQVRGRAERIGALEPNLLIADETELGVILGHVALNDIRKTGKGGKPEAIAGTVIGYITVILAALVITVLKGIADILG